ncbi:MAG: sensor histidine kinase [Clostridia bacterium]|nr:sensor histidine kinase [Clostridia bacterium]
MKELSLNILDIAENSVRANATLINITIIEDSETLKVTVKDDGCGMTKEILGNVTNPFCTTRTTRKVGLGIPLLKLQAEQTGGSVTIVSKHKDEFPDTHGTETEALFYKNHIDMTPLGDIIATVITLIQCNENLDFLFTHTTLNGEVRLDTRELREVLGDVPLNTVEVIMWIKENLIEQYEALKL